MSQLSTQVRDEFAESKLAALLAACFSTGNDLSSVRFLFSAKLPEDWKEEPLDTLKRSYALTLDAAYQRRLHTDLNQRYPSAEASSIEQFPRGIAVALAWEIASRVADTASTAISDAIKSKSLEHLKVAIEGAVSAARYLCNDFFFFHEGGETRLTFADFNTDRFTLGDACLGVGSEGGFLSDQPWLLNIANAIEAGSFFRDIFENYPKVDVEMLALNKATFGAKAAHLIALKNAAEQLKPFLEKVGEVFEVPEFTLIPADQYASFGSSPAASSEVRAAYHWIAGRRVMIRSSAVHSEDGEHLGAGVYASYLLPAGASFDTFCEVVGKVYESVNSPLAKEYRRQIGFDGQEEMGVVVQEYIEREDYRDPAGHINTVRPQMPMVCDVVSQSRYIPEYSSGEPCEIENDHSTVIPLYKHVLSEQFVGYHRTQDLCLVLPGDYTQKFDLDQACSLGKLGILVEMYFNQPLQLEYVCSNYRTCVVQARPLPKTWTDAAKITFPDREDCLWRGESFGVMDQVLEVLSDEDTNCNRTGLVILDSGFKGSNCLGWLETVMPKKGAVWLLRPSNEMRGHVESRCAERGLLVITGQLSSYVEGHESREEFLNKIWAVYGYDRSKWLFAPAFAPKVLPPSDTMRKLRVVSNGLEARIYCE